jgi:hypothetical protein
MAQDGSVWLVFPSGSLTSLTEQSEQGKWALLQHGKCLEVHQTTQPAWPDPHL